MKSWIKILSFLMLILVLTAEDCGNSGNSYVAREDVFQTIEKEFTGDEISTENRIAFEKRAIQKLKDIADYINIYADSGYSAEFRLQASQMIKDAFYSEQDLQKFLAKQDIKEDTLQHILFAPDGSQIRTGIDYLSISQEFHLTSDSEYEGEISFRFSNQGNSSEEKVKIIACKTSKQFGDNSLSVWNLYFEL